MKITVKKLQEMGACLESIDAFPSRWGKEVDSIILLKSLGDRGNFEWANWLIVNIMGRKQYLAYAIFAAEQVLDIFEKQFPEDNRPRLAIEAAKKVLKKDTPAARDASGAAAWAAARAAGAAWAAAWAVGAAAWAARDAAGDAAGAAGAAAWAVGAAAWAARDAAGDAAGAAGAAAGAAMKWKILNYGINLLERGKDENMG